MVKRILILLDRLHWLWLALAASFLLFPSPKRSPVMLVVPALFLLRWLALRAEGSKVQGDTPAGIHPRPSAIPSTPLNGALLLLLGMVLVSLWATLDINLSLPKISGAVLGLGIFFAFLRQGQTSRGWWLGLLLFLGIGVGIAALGLLGTQWAIKLAILTPIVSHLSPLITGLPGAEEGFNPNTLAGALLWVIPGLIAFSWMLLTINKDMRDFIGRAETIVLLVVALAATLWTMAIFILAQAREGYLALALTLPVLILVALPPKWRWRGLALLALLAIILGMALVSHWGELQIWETGSNLSADPALSLDTLQGRLEVWSRAIQGIQDFPITGMGMNAFRKAMPILYPWFNYGPIGDIGHAHNEFLQAALDLGIPGLIAFIALYMGAFWMLVDIWKATRHPQPNTVNWSLFTDHYSLVTRSLTLGLGGGLLAHLLWGLTDAIALGARPGFLFWIILGLISALHQQIFDQPVPGSSQGKS